MTETLKGGRPLSQKEREATETALQIIRTTKNIAIKARMVELLFRADQAEKERRDAAAERAALRDGGKATAEAQQQIAAITQELETAKETISELQAKNADLKQQLADANSQVHTHRSAAEDLRSKLAQAEERPKQMIANIRGVLEQVSDTKRRESIAKWYFREGHKRFDEVFDALCISVETVAEWLRTHEAKAAEEEWERLSETNETLRHISGRSPRTPTPVQTKTICQNDRTVVLIPEPEKPKVEVDSLDEYIATLKPLEDDFEVGEINVGHESIAEANKKIGELLDVS